MSTVHYRTLASVYYSTHEYLPSTTVHNVLSTTVHCLLYRFALFGVRVSLMSHLVSYGGLSTVLPWYTVCRLPCFA